MSDTAGLIVPDGIIPPAEPDDMLAALGIPSVVLDMARGLGLDLDGLAAAMSADVDPDALSLLDVVERVDQLAEQLDRIEPALEPVGRIVAALNANAGKLKRFGIAWQP